MRILIILPNWLGDAIMTTPAIEQIIKTYQNPRVTLVGSAVSIEAFSAHPDIAARIVDQTKTAKSRIRATYELAKSLGTFDIAISFRNQIHANMLLYFTHSTRRIARRSWHALLFCTHAIIMQKRNHLVEQYLSLVEPLFLPKIAPLKLYTANQPVITKSIGINAGATYGSAKRWIPARFARSAAAFEQEYRIILFGGPNEIEIAHDIEQELRSLGVTNIENKSGQTTIAQLIETIASLTLFITNDSGPMHIAAAFNIPTVALFGPTKSEETSPWLNPNALIINKHVKCAPCMKRQCPLDEHLCMESIDVEEVVKAAKTLI